ncbi:MAG: class I SAM-dependent methyltransferase [Deltaproteobacteria bacterium]|nr:class I SAM-dependent methyltransferase [Deltaproteobacteria bacterium]
MGRIRARVPEGGAIVDGHEMSMEQYSEIMKRQLHKEYIRFAENVINKTDPQINSRVLEIGPGPGWAGINLLQKRRDLILVGVEASADMVRVALKNAKEEAVDDRCEYKIGFAENMQEIDNSSIDLVISRDSLHHWADPHKVFDEIKRVLKPDGKLFIHDSRRDMNLFGRMIVAILSKFIPHNMGKYWKSSIAASYTPDEIKNILETGNLEGWIVTGDFMDLVISKA